MNIDMKPRGDFTPGREQAFRGQTRIAYLLAERWKGRLLHVHGLGWHYWDGRRWAFDDKRRAHLAVLDVLEKAWPDALADEKLAKDIRGCMSEAAQLGVLGIAEALPVFAATAAELDADPYLLNVANGTLDLRTLELRAHDPADRITKVTRAAYDPDADQSAWLGFLSKVLPDSEVRDYLARFIGVALLGQVVEQVFSIVIGTGANGKGVFYNTVLHALGDYGHVARPELFMESQTGAHQATPEAVALLGARLVVCSESERNARLGAAVVKQMTGGDPITARALRRDPITFDPSHTIIMVTNWLPRVAGDDPAIWRRMVVIPFEVVIPKEDRDPRLAEQLQLSADAVLAWAVAGYEDYSERGDLEPPPQVQTATEKYQRKSDAITGFMNECCITGPHYKTPFAELFTAWEKYASEVGAEPIGKPQFGEHLDRRGFPVKRTKRCRYREGIALLSQDAEE